MIPVAIHTRGIIPRFLGSSFNQGLSPTIWTREVPNALGEAPVTCEIVRAEACYLLANSPRAVDLVLAWPGQGRVIVEPVLDGKAEQIRTAVANNWPTMDVADDCVLQLAERFPKAKVITTDVRDFRICRRNRNDPIPLLHP